MKVKIPNRLGKVNGTVIAAFLTLLIVKKSVDEDRSHL
jgi:hypothetical protein